jgi:hypothetical protein
MQKKKKKTTKWCHVELRLAPSFIKRWFVFHFLGSPYWERNISCCKMDDDGTLLPSDSGCRLTSFPETQENREDLQDFWAQDTVMRLSDFFWSLSADVTLARTLRLTDTKWWTPWDKYLEKYHHHSLLWTSCYVWI